TTLIESGVDIPNVNTILIDRADRFGLADLYQLRGRVGRANRQAYAYLLTPAHGHLPSLPRRRLRALLEHAELGAGFRLALRDLEIRGAGNLLGAEQSGYIAAIGFDLYCQLLRRTIAQLSGQAVLPPVLSVELALDFIDLSTRAPLAEGAAFLPADYVEDERLRLGIYRQIAAASTEQEIQALREELRDRFGQLPLPLERLLQLAALRILAAARNISSIETRANRLMLKRGGEYLMRRHHFPRLKATQADERLQEIRAWLAGITPAGLSG
ncbi:MAG: transcription-repair coupling factor, partial [Lentisphaerae bacterium]|nr:transcription-repair coupling factor [Lentisphaerota bacterium]